MEKNAQYTTTKYNGREYNSNKKKTMGVLDKDQVA